MLKDFLRHTGERKKVLFKKCYSPHRGWMIGQMPTKDRGKQSTEKDHKFLKCMEPILILPNVILGFFLETQTPAQVC